MAPADAELVARLVDVLDQLGEDEGWDGPGVLLRSDADRVDVLSLAGRHPRELLLGHRFEARWEAIGLLTWGWGAPPGKVRPSAHPNRVRARTAIVVGRSGGLCARSHLADGVTLDELPEGWLVDCLLRTVDRPTAPPASGTEVLFAAHWLGNVLAAAQRTSGDGHLGGLSWEDAARLHPALQMLAVDESSGIDPVLLVPAAAALSRVVSWAEVRRECIGRSWLTNSLSPTLAEWMDTGMLSRWILEDTRSVDELLEQANAWLSPGVARRVTQSLRELGVASAGGDDVAGRQDLPLPVNSRDATGDRAGGAPD